MTDLDRLLEIELNLDGDTPKHILEERDSLKAKIESQLEENNMLFNHRGKIKKLESQITTLTNENQGLVDTIGKLINQEDEVKRLTNKNKELIKSFDQEKYLHSNTLNEKKQLEEDKRLLNGQLDSQIKKNNRIIRELLQYKNLVSEIEKLRKTVGKPPKKPCNAWFIYELEQILQKCKEKI
jgi:hypothetical protein